MAPKIFKTIIKLYNFLVSNFGVIFYLILRRRNKKKPHNISTIIFSFDRPLQLSCILDSINRYQQHSRTLIVIYKASNNDLLNSYQILFEKFKETLRIHPFNENEAGFKNTLICAIQSRKSSHYLFYVDDQVVLSDLYIDEITEGLTLADIFTYRMGLNTTYCYTLDKYQCIKNYSLERHVITWSTALEKNDVNYPFSLDGTAIPAILIDSLARWMIYHGPNSFEGNMNYSNLLCWFLRIKISAPQKQKCVNFVLGRVQNEVENRSLEYDNNYLHELFMKGYQLRAIEGISLTLNSPHTEKGFEFTHQQDP